MEGCRQAEGGEALAQPPAAEEPERRGWPKNHGPSGLVLLSGGERGSMALAQRRDPASTPTFGSCPSWGTAVSAAWEVILGCKFYPGWRGCLS